MKQSSNWLLVILDHKKMKPPRWRFLKQQQTPAATPARGSAAPTLSAVADSTLVRGQNLQPIFEQVEDEDLEDEQEAIEHPRLRQTIQRDHPIDNILGSL